MTLGFLWSVTTQQLALEMAVALPVPSMAKFPSVKVYRLLIIDMDTHLFYYATAITCPPLSIVTNGSVSYSNMPGQNNSYDFNVMATYSCNFGFALLGNNTRNCSGDGSSTTGDYEGIAPTCERKWL